MQVGLKGEQFEMEKKPGMQVMCMELQSLEVDNDANDMEHDTQELVHTNANKGDVEDMTSPEVYIEDAVDSIRFGYFHYRLFIICGLGWMSDASEGAVLSFLLPQLRTEWGITTAQEGNLGSTSAMGQALGALTMGILSDYVGRKPAFIASTLGSAVFGALTAFAPSYTWMLLLRFCAGFAFGGNLPLAVSMIAELMPVSHRSKTLVLLQLFIEAGGLGAALVAHLCMPDWRSFVLWTSVPAAVALPMMVLFVPESPSYLVTVGKIEEAKSVLQGICETNGCAEENVTCYANLADPSAGDKASNGDVEDEHWRGIGVLGKPGVRGPAIAVVMLWFGAQIGSGWYMWMIEVAHRVGLGDISTSIMVVARVAVTVGLLLISFLVGIVPMKVLTMATLVAVGAATLLFSTVVSHSPGVWTFSGSYVSYAFFMGCAWPLLYVLTPKCFPVKARSTGVALASCCSKLGSFVQPQIAGHLLDRSMFMAGLVYSSGWALGVAAVAYIAGTVQLQAL